MSRMGRGTAETVHVEGEWVATRHVRSLFQFVPTGYERSLKYIGWKQDMYGVCWIMRCGFFGMMMGLSLSFGGAVFAQSSVSTSSRRSWKLRECRAVTWKNYRRCMQTSDTTWSRCRRSCPNPRQKQSRSVCMRRCERDFRDHKKQCRRLYQSERSQCQKDPTTLLRIHEEHKQCLRQAQVSYQECLERNEKNRWICRRQCAADCPRHHPCRVRCRQNYAVHRASCHQTYLTMKQRCQ